MWAVSAILFTLVVIPVTYYAVYKKEYETEKSYLAFKVLLSNSTWCEGAKTDSAKAIKELFSNESVQKLLLFNRYQEVLYFNSENFDELLKLLFLNNLVLQSDSNFTTRKISDGLTVLKKISKAAKSAGFRVSDVTEYL